MTWDPVPPRPQRRDSRQTLHVMSIVFTILAIVGLPLVTWLVLTDHPAFMSVGAFIAVFTVVYRYRYRHSLLDDGAAPTDAAHQPSQDD